MMPRPIKVLLVDDEERLLANLARLLRQRGFQVATAGDGQQALAALGADQGFDVAVVDLMMPGLDGIATLKEAKRLVPGLEVIMLTGNASLESGVAAMRAGAYDYLLKPCDVEDLAGKLKEARRREAIQRRPVLWPRRQVADLMLGDLPGLTPQSLLSEALAELARAVEQGAPTELYLTDQDGRPVGLVRRRDLLAAGQEAMTPPPEDWDQLLARPGELPAWELRRVMAPVPGLLDPRDDLAMAAQRLMAAGVQSLPVASGGRMLGVVWLAEILHHLGQARREDEEPEHEADLE